ncbi:MAG: hypothetical protein ACMZ64_12065 [Oleiphilus sp.]
MRNLFKTLLLIYLAVFLAGCSQEDSNVFISQLSDSYGAFGMGQTTCPEYTKYSSNDNYNTAMLIWLEGYFTSVNMFMANSGFEINDNRIAKGIEFLKIECAKTENANLWVPTVASVFWRSEFKNFLAEAK